jgi:hypothetical protein
VYVNTVYVPTKKSWKRGKFLMIVRASPRTGRVEGSLDLINWIEVRTNQLVERILSGN